MVQWTEQQQFALDRIVVREESWPLLGWPGTGKSEVLKECIRRMEGKGRKVAKLAPTTEAANHIDGCTIESFLKIPIVEDQLEFVRMMAKRSSHVDLLADVYLFEEISLVSPLKWTLVDIAARIATKKWNLPFGGRQVVVSGDFAQLPQVLFIRVMLSKVGGGFPCYTHSLWQKVFQRRVIFLTQVVRQDEAELLALLGRARFSSLTADDATFFQGRRTAYIEACKADAIPKDLLYIFPKVAQVERKNREELERLGGGETYTYAPTLDVITNLLQSQAEPNKEQISAIYKVGLCVEAVEQANRVTLKVGAVVQFTHGAHRGRRGAVVGFKLEEKRGRLLVPVVRFFTTAAAGVAAGAADTTTVNMETFTRKGGLHVKDTIVTLLPLKLHWASTVHGVQCKTLDNICVQLDEQFFMRNQGYVAISRVRKMSGLFIIGKIDVSVVQGREREARLEKCWIESFSALSISSEAAAPTSATALTTAVAPTVAEREGASRKRRRD